MLGGTNFEYEKINHTQKMSEPLRFYIVCQTKKTNTSMHDMLHGTCSSGSCY